MPVRLFWHIHVSDPAFITPSNPDGMYPNIMSNGWAHTFANGLTGAGDNALDPLIAIHPFFYLGWAHGTWSDAAGATKVVGYDYLYNQPLTAQPKGSLDMDAASVQDYVAACLARNSSVASDSGASIVYCGPALLGYDGPPDDWSAMDRAAGFTIHARDITGPVRQYTWQSELTGESTYAPTPSLLEMERLLALGYQGIVEASEYRGFPSIEPMFDGRFKVASLYARAELVRTAPRVWYGPVSLPGTEHFVILTSEITSYQLRINLALQYARLGWSVIFEAGDVPTAARQELATRFQNQDFELPTGAGGVDPLPDEIDPLPVDPADTASAPPMDRSIYGRDLVVWDRRSAELAKDAEGNLDTSGHADDYPKSVRCRFQEGRRRAGRTAAGEDVWYDAVAFSATYQDGRVGDLVTFGGVTYKVAATGKRRRVLQSTVMFVRYDLALTTLGIDQG